MDLKISLDEIEQVVILRLKGRLDTVTAPILDHKIQKLIEEKHHQLALDFEHVDYLSSSGMRVLLQASRRLAGKGTFVIFSLSTEVEEVLQMAGFDKILHIFPTEKEAIQFKK